MAFICLRQDAQCPSPWGPLSLIFLGSAVACDLVFEYWFLERAAKNKATKQGDSRTEDANVDSVYAQIRKRTIRSHTRSYHPSGNRIRSCCDVALSPRPPVSKGTLYEIRQESELNRIRLEHDSA